MKPKPTLTALVYRADTTAIKRHNRIMQFGANWRLFDHGIHDFSYIARAGSRMEALQWHHTHPGRLTAVTADTTPRAIVGRIMTAETAGRYHVIYRCKGIAAAHLEDQPIETIYAYADTRIAALKDALTNYTTAVSSNHALIIGPYGAIGGEQIDPLEATTVKEFIRDLLDGGATPGGESYIFYLNNPIQRGPALEYPIPICKAFITSNADTLWTIRDRDLVNPSAARSVKDLVSKANVYYGTITGTHTGGNGSGSLQDNTKNFRTLGVQPGDRIVNITDGSTARVAWIDPSNDDLISTTGLSDGTDDDFDTGDTYAIEMKTPISKQTATGNTSYYPRIITVSKPAMDSTKAARHATTLINDEITMRPNLTIGAPMLTDRNATRQPLYNVFTAGRPVISWQSGSHVNIKDFFNPAGTYYNYNVTGMDYDHDAGTLRMTIGAIPSTLSDALTDAGITRDKSIARGRVITSR
jgi:hypothetical protein